MDGTDDGKWLDIEYEKVPSYFLYCKLQGNLEIQCRNKARDDKVKAQREEQNRKEKEDKQEQENNGEDGFQTVTRRRSTKDKKISVNHQQSRETDQNKQLEKIKQIPRENRGISIREPSEINQLPIVKEVLGKGKGTETEENMVPNNKNQVAQSVSTNAIVTDIPESSNKRRKRGRKKN